MGVTYAISDLHLHCDEQPNLFTPEKEAVLSQLVEEVLEVGGHLVVVGDAIDFIGMQKPERGHFEFFEELFGPAQLRHPAIHRALAHSHRVGQLRGVKERFPGFFRSIALLAREGRLTFIPGNHDCYLSDPDLQETFCAIAGIERRSIRWARVFRAGDDVLFAHGNQFDPSNRTVRDCHNRGAIIAASFYNALIPALEVYGLPEPIVRAVPAVRPEEAVIRGIEEHLGPREARELVAAFVRLIGRNGYFNGLKKAALFPLIHPVPIVSQVIEAFLTPEQFSRALPEESYMKDHVRKQAERLHARLRPRVRAVVLGHTHVLDHTDRYMNLGTWIDHMTGISLDHLKQADTRLPVLRVEHGGELSLHDARDLARAGRLSRCGKIYALAPDAKAMAGKLTA